MKAFIKSFEVPQRSVKTKKVNYISSSGTGVGSVKGRQLNEVENEF